MTMSNYERAARIDLAAAFRLAARFGYEEGVANHFSVALDDDGSTFLVNPHGLHFSEVRASDLIVVDKEGNVLAGDGALDRTAFCIHSRVHLTRPDARCVLHTHMPYATALAAVEGFRLEPVHQTSLRFHERVAYDDGYTGLALEVEEGDRMCRALGEKEVLFLANHGVIVAAPTVADGFDTLYFLERACQTQWLALATNLPLRRVTPDVAAATRDAWLAAPDPGAMHFAALKRMLDRESQDYAD